MQLTGAMTRSQRQMPSEKCHQVAIDRLIQPQLLLPAHFDLPFWPGQKHFS